MSQPKVRTLIDEVQYAEGAIVSRIVHERPVGSITLFAVDQGQSIKEHTSPYDAFVYVLDGRAVFTIGGQDYELAAGQALILPANQPHGLRAPERCRFMLVMIRG